MTFIQRRLEFTFTLGEGQFGETGSQTVKVSGLRASANIVKAGGVSMGTANLQVYGMKLATMNQLSTLGMQVILTRRNSVSVMAGDDKNGMSKVFEGTIVDTWSDMQSAPDVPFHVNAQAGLIEAVKPAASSSYTGSTDVATIMQSLAGKMGLAFENHGVNASLADPYFFGSARNQAQTVAMAAGIEWIIDNGVLAIWPGNGSRGGDQPPTYSKDNGMVGYPAYTSKGVKVRVEFSRAPNFGTTFNVQSDLTPACGTWVIYRQDFDLQALTPRGHWFMDLSGVREGLGPVLP